MTTHHSTSCPKAQSSSWASWAVQNAVGITAAATPIGASLGLTFSSNFFSAFSFLGTNSNSHLEDHSTILALNILFSCFYASSLKRSAGELTKKTLEHWNNYFSSNQAKGQPTTITKIFKEHLFPKNYSSNQSIATLAGLSFATFLYSNISPTFLSVYKDSIIQIPATIFTTIGLSLSYFGAVYNTKKVVESLLNTFYSKNKAENFST